MGGSRRKVTASRKSTQKRQQQFFEQRKRQQQLQDATTVESHNDGPVSCDNQKGNRSLDILSLLSVPKVSAEHRPACGSERSLFCSAGIAVLLSECLQDTEEPTRGNHLDPFPISEDVFSPFRYTENELSPVRGMKLGARRSEMNSLHEDRDTNFWNAGSFLLDNNIVNESCGLNWRNGDANILPDISSDFGSEEPQLWSRSKENITGRYNDLDEGDHHFCSLEEPKYSSFMHDYKAQATRFSPYVEMDDRRDCLTSLSEESCSSSAVRGRNISQMPSGTHVGRYCEDRPWQLNSNVKDNLQEVQDIMTGAMRWGQENDRSRKFQRSNSRHAKSAYISQSTVNKKFRVEDNWPLEEHFPFGNRDTDPGSFIEASEKNRLWSPGSDPFGNDGQADLPKTSSKSKCCFGTSRNKTFSEFLPEDISFSQTFCSRQSFNTSYSAGGSYRKSSHGVHHGQNIPVQSSNSADVADFFGDTEAVFPVPELSAQGSVTEEVSDKLESNPEKISLVSAGNLNASQESRSTAGETNLEENGNSPCKEKNDIDQEMITCSSEEDAEDTPLPVEIQDELDGKLNTKELRRSIPVLSRQNFKVSVADVGCFINTSVNDDNLKGFKPKTTLIDPSCQVMTVERYVLQLMCVSKGKSPIWNAATRLA